MKLKIGISPCPNDTFIFESLFTQKISIPNIELEFSFHDIDELNLLTNQKKLDIAKISFAQLFSLEENYQLLNAGSAMGFGVGPLLISKNKNEVDLSISKVAIPGYTTTANFLLSYLYPQIIHKEAILFNEIEEKILSNKYDAGLVIHESRFTYQEKGLHKIADLGEEWFKKTKLPIPLGCIVANKKIIPSIIIEIENAIRQSINISWQKFPTISPFVETYAQEMSIDVIRKHIELYVNEFSLNLGEDGNIAIEKMRQVLRK